MGGGPEIPRIIHRIWLGPSPLPERFQEYGETWAAHHPSWEHRLWTDNDVSQTPFADAVGRGRWPAERADLLRYELLCLFGGLYIDTDIECLKPVDPLFADVTLLAAWEIPGRRIGNAMLATCPAHPALEQIRREAYEALQEEPVEHSISTGPPVVTRVLKHHADATILGPEAFYPPIRGKDLYKLEGVEPPVSEADLRCLRALADSDIATSGLAASSTWPERTFGVHYIGARGRERYDPSLEVERLRVLLQKATKTERKLRDRLNSMHASAWWQLGLKLRLAPAHKRKRERRRPLEDFR